MATEWIVQAGDGAGRCVWLHIHSRAICEFGTTPYSSYDPVLQAGLTNARVDIVVGMLLYIYALMHLKARDELRSQRTKATRDSCHKAGGGKPRPFPLLPGG